MGQYLLFDLFKAFHYIESSHKSDFLNRKDQFSYMRAQHVMSTISTMVYRELYSKVYRRQ